MAVHVIKINVASNGQHRWQKLTNGEPVAGPEESYVNRAHAVHMAAKEQWANINLYGQDLPGDLESPDDLERILTEHGEFRWTSLAYSDDLPEQNESD